MKLRNNCVAIAGYAALFFTSLHPLSAIAQEPRSFKDLVGRFEELPQSLQLNILSQASELSVTLARLRPNPTISVEVENVIGSSPFNGLNSAETTLQISQDLQLFGRRDANINYARSLANMSTLEIGVKKQEYIRDLALLWLDFDNNNYQLNLANDLLEAANEDLNFISLLVEGGREPALRKLQAQVDQRNAQLALVSAQSRVAHSRNLILTIAQIDGDLKSQENFLEKTPKLGGFDIIRNPQYQLLQSKLNSGRAAIELARTENKPNMSAYIGARHFAASDAVGLVGGVNMSVPLGARSQAINSQRSAQARAISYEIDDFVRNMERRRLALIAQISATSREISQISANAPMQLEIYELSKIGLRAGKINLIEVQAARSELFAIKDRLRVAKYERARAEIELAFIDGRIPFEVAQ